MIAKHTNNPVFSQRNAEKVLDNIPFSVWGIAAGFIFLSALYGVFVPLNGDEALYWQHGRYLDWGFYTHPPMTGFLIRISTTLLGDTLLGVRLISSFLVAATLLLVYLLSWESTENRQTSFLAAIIYLLFPMTFGLGVMMVTDVPLLFFHTAAVFFLRKALIDSWPPGWLLTGLMGGLMMQSKMLGALLVPGIFLFLLIHPKYRQSLLQWRPYAGLIVGLLVFSPFLMWNHQNGWQNFEFTLSIRTQNDEFNFRSLQDFLGSFILVYTPVIAAALLFVLPKHLLPGNPSVQEDTRKQDSLMLLAWIHVGILGGYFLLSLRHSFGAHWLGFLQPLSAILLAEALTLLTRGRRTASRWWSGLGKVSLLSVGLPLYIVLLLPKILPQEMIYLSGTKHHQRAVSNYFGWEEAGAHISGLMKKLGKYSPDLFLSSKDYSLASMLTFYTPGNPDFALFNYSSEMHGREYLEWSRPLLQKNADTLMVSDSPNTHHELTGLFREITPLPELEIRDQTGLLRVFYFHHGKGYLGTP